MKKRWDVYLIAVLLVTLVLSVIGINWGVPDQARADLVFRDQEVLQAFLPVMVETRREIREMINFAGDVYKPEYNDSEGTPVNVKGRDIFVSKALANALRTFLLRTYYPDEHMVLIALANMNISGRDFNPKLFNYGGAFIYPTGAWLAALSLVGLIHPVKGVAYYLQNPFEMGKLYIAGRLLGVLAVLLTAWVIYLAGRRFFSRRAGLLAALFFGIAPLTVIRSHYLSPYPIALLFAAAALYFSLHISQRCRLTDYLRAGFCCGLSAGAVVISGFSAVSVIAGGLIYYLANRRTVSVRLILRNLLLAGLAGVAAFLLTNPYLLISWSEFLAEMQFNRVSVAQEMQVFQSLHSSIPAFWFYVAGSLKTGFVWPLLLAGLAGVVVIFRRRKRPDILLGTAFLMTFVFTGITSPWFVRRSIFLTPLLVLPAGILLDSLLGKPARKWSGRVILCLAVGYTLLYSLAYLNVFTRPNIRDDAGAWINNNIPEGSAIGLAGMPAPYRTPPFAFYRYRLTPTGLDRAELLRQRPEYFVISEYELIGTSQERAAQFFSGYSLVRKFTRPARIFGLTFGRTGLYAKDWWQPNPDVYIYVAK